MNLLEWWAASSEVVFTSKTMTELQDELTGALKEQDAPAAALADRYQGLADQYAVSGDVAEEFTHQLESQTEWLADIVPALTKEEQALKDAAKAQREHSDSMAVAAGIAGTLTTAQDDYQAIIAETTPEIEALTREIAEYEAAQGTSWTVTTTATASLAEYELAQIKAAEATVKLTEYTGDNREELLTLQVAAENANEKVGKLGEQMGITTTYTADYTTKLAENHAALAELKLKNEAAMEAMKLATAEFLYQQIAADLDAAAQVALARELGLIDEPTYQAAKAAQELKLAYDDERISAAELAGATGNLRDIINSLQSRNIEITISTIYKEFHQGPQHEGDTGAGGEGNYGNTTTITNNNTTINGTYSNVPGATVGDELALQDLMRP
jgi:hypothetical protein